ncbi:uncharacterized protein LOC135923025 isoform X2 [Gordionus sp. m RMFG-2023]|uniref:uncharacterized protein LOC135923025 isoform X2 n=1 Tax=Gordionus sp. m RMFG-2023 TaxID=3053472 RepID=UPI0031FDC00E
MDIITDLEADDDVFKRVLGDLDETQGCTLYEEGAIITLPLVCIPGIILFPEQILPLRLKVTSLINQIKACIEGDRVFAFIPIKQEYTVNMFGHSDLKNILAQVGTTAQIIGFSEERIGNERDNQEFHRSPYLGIKSKGQQRFSLIKSWVKIDNTLSALVRILPDIRDTDPLYFARSNAWNRLVFNNFEFHISSTKTLHSDKADDDECSKKGHVDLHGFNPLAKDLGPRKGAYDKLSCISDSTNDNRNKILSINDNIILENDRVIGDHSFIGNANDIVNTDIEINFDGFTNYLKRNTGIPNKPISNDDKFAVNDIDSLEEIINSSSLNQNTPLLIDFDTIFASNNHTPYQTPSSSTSHHIQIPITLSSSVDIYDFNDPQTSITDYNFEHTIVTSPVLEEQEDGWSELLRGLLGSEYELLRHEFSLEQVGTFRHETLAQINNYAEEYREGGSTNTALEVRRRWLYNRLWSFLRRRARTRLNFDLWRRNTSLINQSSLTSEIRDRFESASDQYFSKRTEIILNRNCLVELIIKEIFVNWKGLAKTAYSIPTDPFSLFCWINKCVPIDYEPCLNLLTIDNIVLRLRAQLNILHNCKNFACKYCDTTLFLKEDVFNPPNRQAKSTFVNPSDKAYEFVTVNRIRNIRVDVDWSNDFTWFTGYSWSVLHCRECQSFLGWAFHSDSTQQSLTLPSSNALNDSSPTNNTNLTSTGNTLRDIRSIFNRLPLYIRHSNTNNDKNIANKKTDEIPTNTGQIEQRETDNFLNETLMNCTVVPKDKRPEPPVLFYAIIRTSMTSEPFKRRHLDENQNIPLNLNEEETTSEELEESQDEIIETD